MFHIFWKYFMIYLFDLLKLWNFRSRMKSFYLSKKDLTRIAESLSKLNRKLILWFLSRKRRLKDWYLVPFSKQTVLRKLLSSSQRNESQLRMKSDNNFLSNIDIYFLRILELLLFLICNFWNSLIFYISDFQSYQFLYLLILYILFNISISKIPCFLEFLSKVCQIFFQRCINVFQIV